MNFRRVVILVLLVLLLIMPVLVMARDPASEAEYKETLKELQAKQVKKSPYSGSPDPVLRDDEQKYEEFVKSLPECQYELCIYVNSPSDGIGHGFIKIRTPEGVRPLMRSGFGFYPSGDDYFGKPGIIELDDDHAWHYKLCYHVNKSTVVKALTVVRKWRYTTYDLFYQNCIHFVNDVIKETGITPPSGPEVYRPGKLADNIRNTPGSVENTNEDKTKEMERGIDGNWYREGEHVPRWENQNDLTPMARAKIETPDDMERLINGKVQEVPADMQQLIAGKRVLMTIEDSPAGVQGSAKPNTIGFIFAGTQVSSVEPTVSNPDYLVYVQDRTLSDIFDTEDPVMTYRIALARGDVRIVPSGAGDTVLMAGAGLLNKAGMLASPSPYLIRTGEQKAVVVGGTPLILSRPSYAILLQEPGQPYSRVINSAGALQGFTTAGAAQAIALSSQGHSQNSGVYLNPVTTVHGVALLSFPLPEGTGERIRQSGGATQFTLQGGATDEGLLIGGAGLSNGYGRYVV